MNRIYHEMVPYDNEEEFKEGSWEGVIRRTENNEIETFQISETTKPPGTEIIGQNGVGVGTEWATTRSSLMGQIPKRWR